MTRVFVVTAYRFGDDESHSYVVGAFSTRVQAKLHSEVEESWRGGKYLCRITELLLDVPCDTEMLDYHYSCTHI
jgi:hypothetical protein